MAVIDMPRSRDEVVLCLHKIVNRIEKRHPGNVFCYVRNVNRPIFVASCRLEIVEFGMPPIFVVEGEVHDHQLVSWPASWQAKSDEIMVGLHDDGQGIIIRAERKPVLTMYL